MPKKQTSQQAATLARIRRTEAYAERVRTLFAATVNQILALNKTLPKLGEGEMFSFDGLNAKKQNEVERMLRQLHSVATMAIQQGVKVEWEEANREADTLVQSVFGKEALSSPEFTAWTKRNGAAMSAFISRSEAGLNLSGRVWKTVQQLRDEMEVAITVSIGDGESARGMSKKVRQYLNDPDLMFRRFRYKKGEKDILDENGNVIGKKPIYGKKWKKRIKKSDGTYGWIDYDRDSYKTGAGVYKSSAKNAMRVARTETNIAYRRADNARWQQMDFVLGQKVQLSRSHPQTDICDTLAGEYPKDFIFDGWHPQCFCFVTPITIPPEETEYLTDMMLRGEDWRSELKRLAKGREIKDYPQNFKDWVTKNKDKINAARDRGNEPYFIRNNGAAIDNILNPDKKHIVPLHNLNLNKKTSEQKPTQTTAVDDTRVKLQSELTDEIAKLPGAGWHTQIKGSATAKLKMYLDNYEILYGEHLTRYVRNKLAEGNLSDTNIKSYIDTFKGATKNNMDAMKLLSSLHNADFSSFPKGWLEDAIKSVKSASSLSISDYISGGSTDPVKRGMVRAIQHCDNMIRLSSNKIAKEYGLEKLSSKTPVELFERFFASDKRLIDSLPDKRFFDGLKLFVPLEKGKSGACCTGLYPPTVKISDDTRFGTIAGLRSVLHHEYGHAYDVLSATNFKDIWRGSLTELRKEFDELKKIITPEWRNNAKSVLDKAFADATTCKLSQAEIDAIEAEYKSKRSEISSKFIRGEITEKKWSKLIGDLINEKENKLGILENRAKITEIRITISDIVEALDPNHNSLGYGGHGKSYWSVSPNRDLAEFIAECSEARHIDYSVLQKAAPEIYALMLKYGKIFWP